MKKDEELIIAELNGKLKGARIDEGEGGWIACLIFERDTAIKMLIKWMSHEEGDDPGLETDKLLRRLGCAFDGTWNLPT